MSFIRVASPSPHLILTILQILTTVKMNWQEILWCKTAAAILAPETTRDGGHLGSRSDTDQHGLNFQQEALVTLYNNEVIIMDLIRACIFI